MMGREKRPLNSRFVEFLPVNGKKWVEVVLEQGCFSNKTSRDDLPIKRYCKKSVCCQKKNKYIESWFYVADGNIENLLWLLTHGAVVERATQFGNNVFMCVKVDTILMNTDLENEAYSQHLLEVDRNTSRMTTESFMALIKAGGRGHMNPMKLLRNLGITIRQKDCDGYPLLVVVLFLCESGDGARKLLETSSKVNSTVDSPMILAVKSGNLLRLRQLQEAGVDMESRDSYGCTALMIAVKYENLEATQILLEYGAAVNVRAKDGRSTLMKAVRCQNMKFLDLLLKSGADIETKDFDGRTALAIAVLYNAVSAIHVLLSHGAHVDVVSDDRKTPLMIAAKRGNITSLGLLLNAKANTDITDRDGNTALSLALIRGHKRSALMLLEYGARVDVMADDGTTPLGHVFNEIIDQDNHLPTHLDLHRYQIADASLQHSARTASHAVDVLSIVRNMVIRGCPPILKSKQFLKFGSKLSLKKGCTNTQTPLELALTSSQPRLARYLLANRFLQKEDLDELPSRLRLWKVLEDISEKDYNLDPKEAEWRIHETQTVVRFLTKSPMSLFTLAFVAVSSAITASDITKKDMDLTKSFNHPTALISSKSFPYSCVEQWLTTDEEHLQTMNDLESKLHPHGVFMTKSKTPELQGGAQRTSDIELQNRRRLTRAEKVQMLTLPPSLKRALLFQTPFAYIDPDQWHTISLISVFSGEVFSR